MKPGKLLIFLAMLALVLGVLTATAYTAPTGPDTDQRPVAPSQEQGVAAAAPAAPAKPAHVAGGGESLSGSFVVFDPSVGGDACYIPGVAQTFCFRAESFTNDYEYVYNLWERFPTDWTVTNVYVQGTPACTSGSWGTFSWSFQTSPYEVNIAHTRYQQTTDHCTAYYCFEVVSGAGTTDALESWYWDGDGYGGVPHWPCSSDQYTPAGQSTCDEYTNVQASIPPCVLPPIMLTPEERLAEGCANEPQVHQFTVLNNAGYDTTVNLSYAIISGGGACTGPASVAVANGGSVPFDVILTPVGVPSDTVVCEITAVDATNPANSDTSLIIKHLVAWFWDPAGWQLEPIANATPNQWAGGAVGTNPAASGPVGYVVGGLAAGSSVPNPDLQMYDPATGVWTQLTDMPNQRFSPVVGWIGGLLYAAGGYDTAFGATNDLQVYNPATNAWDNTSYADMPNIRGGGAGGVGVCASGSGPCLFHVGGGPDSSFANTTLETWQYDPGVNAWTQLDSKPAGSSPDGHILGAGVGCQGRIYVGGDYRGFHEFYRLDATQPAGSQWTPLANIPAAAGAMTPALVCKEEAGVIVLIGGDPDGGWGTYNTTVYVYDIASDAWSGPLPQTLNVGQLGSVGWHMYDKVWTAGGTVGSGAISPMPFESLAQIQCVVEPPPIEWEKYVDGVEWYPGMQITRQTSDTIEVVEVLHLPPAPPASGPGPAAQPVVSARSQQPASPPPTSATETTSGVQPPKQALPAGAPRPLNGGGLLYMTSLDFGNLTFAVYDPATDAWTALAPYMTTCQMAVSQSGQLYAYGNNTATIDLYDPSTDTWTAVMPGPPGAAGNVQCNLKITAAGEFLFTQWNDPTLWYTVGGVWNSLPLPFNGNAIGDYDPTADQYVIGQQFTTNAHWIDVHTWTMTDYTSPVGNGENARFGVAMGNRFYFEAGGSNIHSFDLASPALPPFDHGVNAGWYTSAGADRANGAIYVASLDGTALSRYDAATNSLTPLTGGPYLWHSSLAFVRASQGPVWAQIETWDPAELELLGWTATGGTVVQEPDRLVWTGELLEPATITLTKWFHVEPCTWTETLLWEELWLDQTELEQRPVVINKLPPMLWIDAVGGGDVPPGQVVSFTLLYGNDGGYENEAMIRNDFPPGAEFANAYPYPDRWDPAGLWAEWDLGDLATGGQGSIEVAVMIAAAAPPSTTLEVWDGIFDHTGELRDWVVIPFHVVQPPLIVEWEKYVDGMPWQPDMEITRQTSDTIEVVEVINIVPPPLAGWKPAAPTPPEGGWLPGPALDLVTAESPAAVCVAPAATWSAPEAILWNNGPLVTHAGACSGMDASRLQTNLLMNTLGFGHQLSVGNRMADDFTITDPSGWQIDTITFFAYQTNAPTDPSPITGVYYQIWDGPPNDPGSSVVFGDLTTNRLLSTTFTNIQRDSETSPCANNRYIFADVASAGVALPPGAYWIDWMTDGSLASGPWAPPVTILGQTTTGNALQYTTSSGAWGPANDSGTLTQQDMPFIVEGTIITEYPVWAQIENWDPAKLHLDNWAATGGQVNVGPDWVEWTGEIVEPTTITLTKWFHVEPCTWTVTTLWEELWVGGVEVDQRPVIIHKLPPNLWIDAVGGGPVWAGRQAQFTLQYGNTGGFENDVMIRNDFPPEAPFVASTPPPDRQDPGGLWAEWDIAGLPQGAQGAIDVTVLILPTLPPSTMIEIWDGIFDHTGELRDWVIIQFHVARRIYLPVVFKNYAPGP